MKPKLGTQGREGERRRGGEEREGRRRGEGQGELTFCIRLQQYETIYEHVKNERNKYMNLIQTIRLTDSELKEKVKILQNEIDILRTETLTKNKGLMVKFFLLFNLYIYSCYLFMTFMYRKSELSFRPCVTSGTSTETK